MADISPESKLKGNAEEYNMDYVTQLEGNPFEEKRILFLGSSVTFGAASLEQAMPEYFKKRFGCEITKEAVSGTTLVDLDETSYVSRMLHRIDAKLPHDLMICQLSTNDATRGLPMGMVGEDRELDSFDTATIAGAMEYIIAYVKKTWNCPVFFYTGARYDSAQYKDMVTLLYQLQEKWQLGVLDLWSDEAFNRITEEKRELYMRDPIHPTRAGYKEWWCPELERQLLEQVSSFFI